MEISTIERLINDISKMPGLGRKSAERIALYLLKNKAKSLTPLIETLKESHDKIIECNLCGNIDLIDPCNICSNNKRDKTHEATQDVKHEQPFNAVVCYLLRLCLSEFTLF